MRLVEQSAVANWKIGRLELFLDGTWGQVCWDGFTAADARVACRQLGYRAGAVWPTQRTGRPPQPGPEQLVYPEVALGGSPGCNGTEQTLLECSGGARSGRPFTAEGCYGSERTYDTDPGLFIACVATEQTGAELLLRKEIPM